MDRKSTAGSTASTIPPYRRHAVVNQLQPAVPAALLEPGVMEKIFKVSSSKVVRPSPRPKHSMAQRLGDKQSGNFPMPMHFKVHAAHDKGMD